ncbi:MAG: carboxyl transferase domain-containing protein [Planctomycetota bacterium]
MSFILPFEAEIHALDDRLAATPEHDPSRAELMERLEALEHEIYPSLDAYETFLLSGHPLRPKTLDYVQHVFKDVRLFHDPDVRGDHLMIAGEAKLDVADRPVDVIIIGQQTGPSSDFNELITLPVAEYRRWNQGMGFPDSYRKAVYAMELAEERGWPVIVFVDTPGADPSEYSEEQGQAFAINEVIHKTTALRVPNLAYIISLGASGGAIAVTPTNRTIMNQYATYMVISPGGCASILFRNRSLESIRSAARGLRLTSRDAVEQGTVDEVVPEGCQPGHRYPRKLLAAARDAVVRNLAQILDLDSEEAERQRRAKFFAMGRWGDDGEARAVDALAKLATTQDSEFTDLIEAVTEYLAKYAGPVARPQGGTTGEESVNHDAEDRLRIAQLIRAVQNRDTDYLREVLGRDTGSLTRFQCVQIRDYILHRRYGDLDGADSLRVNGGVKPGRRLHPVDWIRKLTDPQSFREFEETIRYRSVDQLRFPQYEATLERGVKSTNLHSGLITGSATIGGQIAVLTINNFGLVGSSLCDEIGEKFRFAAHRALETRTPLVSIAMGGGARMQEGTPSMHRNIPKAQHALNELEEAGIPHISVIADPTLGGTAISYGLRGDYMIVVKGSTNIGFSGQRVVEQFQRRKVSADFQRGFWLLNYGFVDEVVALDDMPQRVADLLTLAADGKSLIELRTRRVRPWRPKETTALETARTSSST